MAGRRMDCEQHQAQNCNESDTSEKHYTHTCSAFESLCRDALQLVVYVVCDQGRGNAIERYEEPYTRGQY